MATRPDTQSPALHLAHSHELIRCRARAMPRILFSRLGEPHIGSPNAFSFNVPSVRVSGAVLTPWRYASGVSSIPCTTIIF
jgi:hypothetical protein